MDSMPFHLEYIEATIAAVNQSLFISYRSPTNHKQL